MYDQRFLPTPSNNVTCEGEMLLYFHVIVHFASKTSKHHKTSIKHHKFLAIGEQGWLSLISMFFFFENLQLWLSFDVPERFPFIRSGSQSSSSSLLPSKGHHRCFEVWQVQHWRRNNDHGSSGSGGTQSVSGIFICVREWYVSWSRLCYKPFPHMLHSLSYPRIASQAFLWIKIANAGCWQLITVWRDKPCYKQVVNQWNTHLLIKQWHTVHEVIFCASICSDNCIFSLEMRWSTQVLRWAQA